MFMVQDIPMKQEVYSIAARSLTDEEVQKVVRLVEDRASVWLEDRRNWPNFDQFLGFHIHRACFEYQLEPHRWPAFIAACNEACVYIGQQFPKGDPSHNKP